MQFLRKNGLLLIHRLDDTKIAPNTACTDEVGSQGWKGIVNKKADHSEKQFSSKQHKISAFASARNVGRRCIMKWSDEPVKPRCGSPIRSSHYFVFGTSIHLLVERGGGMSLFAPQAMPVSSCPSCKASRRWRTNCAADCPLGRFSFAYIRHLLPH